MDQINVAVSAVSTAVRETVPMWLNSLPIPDTLAGYAELSGAQWMRLTPLFLAVLAHVIVLLHFFTKSASPRVNTQIDLKSELVSPRPRMLHVTQCRLQVLLVCFAIPTSVMRTAQSTSCDPSIPKTGERGFPK